MSIKLPPMSSYVNSRPIKKNCNKIISELDSVIPGIIKDLETAYNDIFKEDYAIEVNNKSFNIYILDIKERLDIAYRNYKAGIEQLCSDAIAMENAEFDAYNEWLRKLKKRDEENHEPGEHISI